MLYKFQEAFQYFFYLLVMIDPCLKCAFRRTIRVIVWKSNIDEEAPACVWSFGRAFHH